MKKEITEAANYIALYLKDAGYSDDDIKCFSVFFTEFFEDRYNLYWFPENTERASGYRSIQILPQKHVDPAFAAIFELAKLNIDAFLSIISHEFTVWIDPGSVSVRVGDRNAPIVNIFTTDKAPVKAFCSGRREKQRFNYSKIIRSPPQTLYQPKHNVTYSSDLYKPSYYPMISNHNYSRSITGSNQVNHSCLSDNSLVYSLANNNSKDLSHTINKLQSNPTNPSAGTMMHQSNSAQAVNYPELPISPPNDSMPMDNNFELTNRRPMKNCRMSNYNFDCSREYFYFNDVLYNTKLLTDWELSKVRGRASRSPTMLVSNTSYDNSHCQSLIQLLQNDPIFQMHMDYYHSKFDVATADEIRAFPKTESVLLRKGSHIIVAPVRNREIFEADSISMYHKLSNNSLYPIPIYE
ncbi:hypothetical protein GJ496_008624 [Pomphorhynchus laevis]|nr:hypothetical protein GJ496_008624 [Pomphorhynchus laevis]